MVSKTIVDSKKRDEAASVVAKLHNVSDRYVRMVINGDRENQAILYSYFDYIEGKNALIEKIKTLIKLDGIAAKSDRMNPESGVTLPLFSGQMSNESTD